MHDNPGHYPYADVISKARKAKGYSIEKAASLVDVTRGTWRSWEHGSWPRDGKLVQIVEAFDLPPAAIGLEAPEGWEHVPAGWIREELDAAEERARLRHEEQMELLRRTLAAVRAESKDGVRRHVDQMNLLHRLAAAGPEVKGGSSESE